VAASAPAVDVEGSPLAVAAKLSSNLLSLAVG
jgi:hypothetical protein